MFSNSSGYFQTQSFQKLNETRKLEQEEDDPVLKTIDGGILEQGEGGGSSKIGEYRKKLGK